MCDGSFLSLFEFSFSWNCSFHTTLTETWKTMIGSLLTDTPDQQDSVGHTLPKTVLDKTERYSLRKGNLRNIIWEIESSFHVSFGLMKLE